MWSDKARAEAMKNASPGSNDSVSCYSRLYNFVWFNNGYHQEHHFRPQVHWTELPTLHPQMLPESERRVVRGWHVAGLWESTQALDLSFDPLGDR